MAVTTRLLRGDSPRQDLFYVWYAALLLCVLFAGFSRTFFLRSLYFEEPLPPIVSAHGLIATTWFGLFFVQSMFVVLRRVRLHRRIGAAGTAVAAAVFLVGVMAAIGVFPRGLEVRTAAGGNADPSMLSSPERWVQVARDSLAFAAFAAFVGLAVMYRRRSQAHRRLMLLASVALSVAAIARVFRWPLLSFIPEIVGLFGGLALLIAIPMLRDLKVDGRIHPALKWGGPVLFGYMLSIMLVLPLLVFR